MIKAEGEYQGKKDESMKSLDGLLTELKELLLPAQLKVQDDLSYCKWPVGMIVGCPRSGTTLLLQWLASLRVFSYPTNLLARFAYAPYIGALIQKIVFDPEYDYKGQFNEVNSSLTFNSNLGKTSGALNVNEFMFFFREYINSYFPEHISEKSLASIDLNSLRKGMASIEKAFDKPFVTKGLIMQFNLDYFYERIPELFLFYIIRKPIFVMQSILKARYEYHGNENTWWSVKPKQYNLIKDMDIYHQVAGQVYFTETAIASGLDDVPDSRKIIIDYEEFCEKPNVIYSEIVNKYKELGCIIDNRYNGPESFTVRNKLQLEDHDIKMLSSAYEDFQANRIDLSLTVVAEQNQE